MKGIPFPLKAYKFKKKGLTRRNKMAINLQDIIREWYSIRSYREDSLADETRSTLRASLATLQRGLLG